MASIGLRIRADGSESWRVQGRSRSGAHEQVTFDTKPAAESFVRLVKKTSWERAREIVTEQRKTYADATTLRTLMPKFLEAQRHVQPGTIAEYRRIPERSGWLQKLGDIPLELLTRDDVEEWLTWRYATPLPNTGKPPAPKTVNEAKSLLSVVMSWCVDRGLAPTNVVKGVKTRPSDGAKKIMITSTQFQALMTEIETVDSGAYAFTMLLATTGMRLGEARALTWGQIGTGVNPSLRVDRAYKHRVPGEAEVVGPPKTKAGNRTVPLPAATLALLGKRGRATALVFRSVRDENLPFVKARYEKIFREAVAATGTPHGFTPHQLRHYYASQLLSQGVPITDVKVLLGHESITTTVDTYGDLIPTANHRAMNAIVNALGLAHHGEIES